MTDLNLIKKLDALASELKAAREHGVASDYYPRQRYESALHSSYPQLRAIIAELVGALEKYRGVATASVTSGEWCTADSALFADDALAKVREMGGES